MRAIDLYSGVGGWSLGLRLAGIEVVAAYEWWKPAADTYENNLGSKVHRGDIRELNLASLPTGVDLVVGSPPCTEFSYSNRGGGGDLSEGMKDLVRFFEVVDHVGPKHWVMENVPRVASLVREAMNQRGHPLFRFRSWRPSIAVLDFSELGLPQGRKRCLIGSLPLEKLEADGELQGTRTLGETIGALGARAMVSDPIWNLRIPASKLTEMQFEDSLDSEQLRMNREAKLFHPVYNNMAFPDSLEAPARTVTATCTRVSRESIVIRDTRGSGFRRLTVRERACLQGFPITFQFYGRSHAEKVKLVGNAFPPPVAFLIGNVASGAEKKKRTFGEVGKNLRAPKALPKITRPEQTTKAFSASRKFRSAIPSLRLGSGVRFDLGNRPSAKNCRWVLRFHYGPSTRVQRVTPDEHLRASLFRSPSVRRALTAAKADLAAVEKWLEKSSPLDLQQIWTRRKVGQGPYDLVDLLGKAAASLEKALRDDEAAPRLVFAKLATGKARSKYARARKLSDNASVILAGLILAGWFNSLQWHGRARAA